MDLSKLPRLSETDKHAPPPAPPETLQTQAAQPALQAVDYGGAAPSTVGSEVWLSAILGLVFMMMGWTFARFIFAKLTGQTFHTHVDWLVGPKTGQEVDYFELQGYLAWTDTAIFLFGFAMLLEAVVLLLAHRGSPAARMLVTIALAVTVGMTLFNLILAGLLLQSGTTPIVSVLAVAFGGFMAMSEWQMLQRMKGLSRA